MLPDPKMGVKVIDKWDSPRRRAILFNGVWYAPIEDTDKLVPGQGMELFTYVSDHIHTKEHKKEKVICYSASDFVTLLNSWNNTTGWHYEQVPNEDDK